MGSWPGMASAYWQKQVVKTEQIGVQRFQDGLRWKNNIIEAE